MGTQAPTIRGELFLLECGKFDAKTQEGLLRTLLYQAFRECPDLADKMATARWNIRVEDCDDSEP